MHSTRILDPDPYLTIGGRYDNSRLQLTGGLNITGAPAGTGPTVVEWNAQQPARGVGLRLWASPFPNYNDSTDVEMAPANGASIELEARVTGMGGAMARRRFVVNTGQETILSIGEYEAGGVFVLAASQAFNVGGGGTNPNDAAFVNFTWMTEMLDSLAVNQRLVSRLYEITTYSPINPTRVVVPPGAIDMTTYGPGFAAPVDLNWPGQAGGGIVPVMARVTGVVPQTVLAQPAPGVPFSVLGAKFVDLLAPVGWPWTTLAFRFGLAPL